MCLLPSDQAARVAGTVFTEWVAHAGSRDPPIMFAGTDCRLSSVGNVVVVSFESFLIWVC